MSNVIKYLGVGLLVGLLAACDGKTDDAAKSGAQDKPAAEASAGQNIELMNGKVAFTLPADMRDQSGKVGTQANNMHVYANDNGQKAVIVILGDNTTEELTVLAQRLEDQQRTRDANLQVVTNKTIDVERQEAATARQHYHQQRTAGLFLCRAGQSGKPTADLADHAASQQSATGTERSRRHHPHPEAEVIGVIV